VQKKCFILVLSFYLLLSCENRPYIQPGTTGKLKITIQNNIETTAILSVPQSYDKNRPTPLLIALHGHGGNAEAFHDLWKTAADSMNVILLVPQGEINLDKNIFHSWGEHTEDIIFSALDIVNNHLHLDREKIFLTGFSLGGSKSYELGLKHSNVFRGIAPICGHFKESFLPKEKSTINHMKIYIGHGELDNYLVEAKKANTVLLENGNQVKLKIYRNTGHTIPDPIEEELIQIIQFFLS